MISRSLLNRLLFPVMALVLPVAVASGVRAEDDYRLCAIRKGECSCQAVKDGPGVWTVMEPSRCTPATEAMAEATGQPAAGQPASKPVTAAAGKPAAKPSTAAGKPPASIAAATAAVPPAEAVPTAAQPTLAEKLNPLSWLGQGSGAATPAAPAPTAAASGYRLCALRKGICLCQTPTDGPGEYAQVDEAICRPAETPTAEPAAAPTATKSKNADTRTGAAAAPGKAAAPAAKSAAVPAAKPAEPPAAAPAPSSAAAAPETASTPAQFDGHQLCVVKNGSCGCRSPEDKPGIWHPAEANRCHAAQKTAAAKPAGAVPPAAAGGLTDCALRNGLCTCKAAGDAAEQWTVVDTQQCKRTLFVNLWRQAPTRLKADTATIRGVQQSLQALGYDTGTTDGRPGLKTTAAITRFQTETGMPVDGQITDILIERLRDLAPDTGDSTAPAAATAAVVAEKPKTAEPAVAKKNTAALAKAKPTSTPALPATPPAQAAVATPALTAYQKVQSEYRLCAPRKGACKCQKIGDDPGVLTDMPAEVCAGAPGLQAASSPTPAAATVASALTAAAAAPAAPEAAGSGLGRLPNPLSWLTSGASATSADKPSLAEYRMCALRKGECLCRAPTDGPGEYTAVDQSVCAGAGR